MSRIAPPPHYRSSSMQDSNLAGTRLPHIPRRTSSGIRPFFGMDNSSDRERVGKKQSMFAPTSNNDVTPKPSRRSSQVPKQGSDSDAESESDCPTPRPASYIRKQEKEEKPSQDELVLPGIAPRARRGRGRKSAVFDIKSSSSSSDELLGEGEDEQVKPPAPALPAPTPPPTNSAEEVPLKKLSEQQSTVVFPSRSSDNSPPGSPTSIRRLKAQKLHLDLDKLPKQAPFPAPLSDGSLRAIAPGITRSQSVIEANLSVPVVRKKSGEVLKSSLKSRSSSHGGRWERPGLASLLGDNGLSGMPSVSVPTTPSQFKAVHWDSKEHVKLFLAEQKPLAVSRDGSPSLDVTSGESGTESEYPFQNPDDNEEAIRKSLCLRVVNLPLDRVEELENKGTDADVVLERLVLAEDARSVTGTVRVKNLAYEKWVAVRFTLDWWQTTSEVAGKWVESCKPPSIPATPSSTSAFTILPPVQSTPQVTFDRFSFSIRLSDMLRRIEEKTLLLAVRYSIHGREFWDNNGGENYKATFERKKPQPKPQPQPVVTGNALGLYLKKELEKVIISDDEEDSKRSQLDRLAGPLSPTKKPDPSSLAFRYDFATALKDKNTWKPPSLGNSNNGGSFSAHARSSTFPSTFSPTSSSSGSYSAVPWPKRQFPQSQSEAQGQSSPQSQVQRFSPPQDSPKFGDKREFRGRTNTPSFNARMLSRGSPREPDPDSEAHRAFVGAQESTDLEDVPFNVSRNTNGNGKTNGGAGLGLGLGLGVDADAGGAGGSGPAARNHQRSYFDTWAANHSNGTNFGFGRVKMTPPAVTSPNGSGSLKASHRSLSDPNMHTPQGSSSGTPVSEGAHSATLSPPLPSTRYHAQSFPPLSAPAMTSSVSAPAIGTSRVQDTIQIPVTVPSVSVQISVPSTPSPSAVAVALPLSGDVDFSSSDSDTSESATSGASTSSVSPLYSPEQPVDVPIKVHDYATLSKRNYDFFLNQFCFYTGNGESSIDIPTDHMRRSQSASSVEELLSATSDAFAFMKTPGRIAMPAAPMRSYSLEDVGTASGYATPTPADLLKSESTGSPAISC